MERDQFPGWHGTTIVGVRKDGKVVVAGDGQVSFGNTVLKASARKIRRLNDGKVIADNVMFGSPAQQAGLDFDWQILDIRVEAERPPKQLMFIPATLLLALVAMLQLRRRKAGAG